MVDIIKSCLYRCRGGIRFEEKKTSKKVSGGKVEYQAILDAKECKEVMIKEYDLSNAESATLGMICGGYNKVLFIPV